MLGGNMENKAIAKEYVDKNYEIWKEIKNYKDIWI